MKSKPCIIRIPAILGLFCLIITGGCAKTIQEADIEALIQKPSLSLEEQQIVAEALFTKMYNSDKSNLEVFEVNYKIVIEKCPDTEQAHTSIHRIINLYTQAYDEPRHEDIIAILEPFLEKTKESKILSMEKYPEEYLVFSPVAALHLSYEELGQYDKIAAYYDSIIKQNPDLGLYDSFDYASALDNLNRLKDAVHWYEIFLKKSEGTDMDFMREIAEERIKEIK